jgi:hypothetical protein
MAAVVTALAAGAASMRVAMTITVVPKILVRRNMRFSHFAAHRLDGQLEVYWPMPAPLVPAHRDDGFGLEQASSQDYHRPGRHFVGRTQI